ncbi:MAG: hypothetical protein A2Z49_04850 [Chloroflexi bacterium RBG_19FT_COMBO_56_12]|nr:MAG: hypothetical protein A2Z49_04850 [Chloroflexi bacterium RBG_19FT_COMBO_56_12]
MDAEDLVALYNYDEFIATKFERWLNSEASSPVGQLAPDHPLWMLDGRVTSLSQVWGQYHYTIVEFGSFT